MKTAIVQLDAFDNLISIKEKIAWSKIQRVLLVWPNKGKIVLNELDIILILRSAESQGAQIAVVTDEPVIINQLKELGISIFSSIPEAQKKPWRKPKIRDRSIYSEKSERAPDLEKLDNRRQTRTLSLSKFAQWITFLSGVLSTAFVILIFVPSANIFLYPAIDEQSIQMNFHSDPTIKEINMAGAVPFTLIEIEIEAQLEGDSTGIIRVPDKKAVGRVTFRNLSNKEILIPLGTVVRTNSDPIIRFETTEQAILAAGVESQIDIPVKSKLGGTSGNVPSGSITSIENDLGGNIVVVNQNAVTGGVDIKTLAPTENDYKKLKKELLKILIDEAINIMQTENPQAFLIAEESIKIDKIISEERIPAVGDPAERHLMRINARLSGWMIDSEDLEYVVQSTMDSVLSAQFLSDEGEVEIILDRDSIDFDQNNLSWTVNSSRKIIAKLDEDLLIQNILGKKIETAESYLEHEFHLSRKPIIEVSPSFWNYLPFFPFRINMVIDGS